MAAGWYAGLVSGNRRAFLAGPYATRAEADDMVERAHALAAEIDPWCHFATPGAFHLEAARLPAGRLNDRLGFDPFALPT